MVMFFIGVLVGVALVYWLVMRYVRESHSYVELCAAERERYKQRATDAYIHMIRVCSLVQASAPLDEVLAEIERGHK